MRVGWKTSRLMFLVLVLGVLTFTIYQYQVAKEEQSIEKTKGLIFPEIQGKEGQIQEIVLESLKEKIHLLRKDQQWRLLSPIKDLADEGSTYDWLEDLFSKKVKVIKKGSGIDWKGYGLSAKSRSLSVTDKAGKVFSLNISYYSAFDGSFFIRKGENLLLGDTSWAFLMDKKFSSFRSYKLLNIAGHPIALSYQSSSFALALEWKNYKWKWKGKPSFPLSQSALESYWSALSTIQLDRENIQLLSEKQKRKNKLLKPFVQLNLKFKGDKEWTLHLSPKIKNRHYALIATRNYIFMLQLHQASRVIQNSMSFRDHSVPFSFQKDQVANIEIKGEHATSQFKKKENEWARVNSKKKQSSDSEQVKKILSRLSRLTAKEYFGNQSFPTKLELLLKDKKDNILLDLKFSASFQLDKKVSLNKPLMGNKMIYVKSSVTNEVVGIASKDFEKLLLTQMLEEKNKSEKTDSKKPSSN